MRVSILANNRPRGSRSGDEMALRVARPGRSTAWRTRLGADGTEYSVDLVARKATGVEGWKITVVFLPSEAGDESRSELPNAASTAEVRRLVTELEGNEGGWARSRRRDAGDRGRGQGTAEHSQGARIAFAAILSLFLSPDYLVDGERSAPCPT
jgi:hypothetical protein